MRADLQVTGTWPLRSELSNRPIASGTNALASSKASRSGSFLPQSFRAVPVGLAASKPGISWQA